jgi:zona occludens toxin
MSISLIVGKPGDGKSYAAVHMCILPALQQGRSLFTNIPINEELARIELSLREDHYIKCIDKEKLEKSDLFDIPGGTLIVLDEVWRYWKKEERKPDTEDEKFFAEHRHKVGRMPGIDGMLSQDIVLITQNTNEIPTWIKGRIASTYKVVKLTAVGADNRFRVDVYRGAQGERPAKDSFISASLGRYSSDVWRYYQSHTLGDTSGGISAGTLEAGPSAKVSIWKNPQLRLYMVVSIIAATLLIYRFGFTDSGLFSSAKASPSPSHFEPVSTKSHSVAVVPSVLPSSEVKNDSQSAGTVVPPIPEASHSGIALSPDWWISGVVSTGEFHKLIITNGSQTRTIKTKDSLCSNDGELKCIFEEIAYLSNPFGHKSILPTLKPSSVFEGASPHRELASNAGVAPSN